MPVLAEWWTDLKVGLIFLTRLPVRRDAAIDRRALGRALRAYPLVGLVVALAGAAAYWLATALALPPAAAALIAVGATLLTTGALHEDGLADTADGFGGGRDAAAKLAIMRDPRSGTYGVAALVLSIALRAAALAALASPGAVLGALAGAHALSRALLPAAMARLPAARSDGLAAGTAPPEPRETVTALVLGAAIALLALGIVPGIVAALAAAGGAAAVAWLARAQVGGHTGDVLGALQQVAETAALLAAVAVL